MTISNELLDFMQTHNITNCHEINSRLDTLNLIELPSNIINFFDEFSPGTSPINQTPAKPQPRGFHITSTDTICVYLFSYSMGCVDVTNVFPTEMLRDEYVVQSHPDLGCNPSDTVGDVGNKGMFQIVATEDSTVVDIVLNGYDWLGRDKDSVVTVVLNKGMMYNDMVGLWRRKYPNCCLLIPPPGYVPPPPCSTDVNRTFTYHFDYDPNDDGTPVSLYMPDITGTYIKARDNKRIAVFQGNQFAHTNFYGYGDFTFEQVMPIRFAGKEFLIPNIVASRVDYIQFVGLVDGTTMTITDPFATPPSTYTRTIDARESFWFIMDSAEGPFYVTADHPILSTITSCGLAESCHFNLNLFDVTPGDPATLVIVPVEWWHNGPANGSPVHYVDDNGNGYVFHHSTHLFTRTEAVSSITFDRMNIDTLFRVIPGTPYSYAYIPYTSRYNSRDAHRIESLTGAPFWITADADKIGEHALFTYSHLQRGKNYLEVNGIPTDSLPADSIWCMYDPIQFHGWVERPADSIIWDFGDGNVMRYRYEDGQWVTHTYADTGRFEVKRIIQYMDEALDTNWGYLACKSVFTRPSDTMYAHIWIHNHYDSAFAVTVCEGPFTFRGHVLETTDTHYVTTYWTESGCDTLWQIDLVTCPHCSFRADTISDEQLPWVFNGISFGHEVRHYPIHIDIDDECDSIIDYYLIVIPHWGEQPLDTTFILAPNVITPDGDIEINRQFHLFCSDDIVAAEVYIFDRMGRRLAHFNGLTEDWDCTYDGKPLPQAAYVYYVRYIDGSNRNWKILSGTFSIVR